jgi:FtsP/CotA-like multicopper oxidase with cupredoxin domain
LKCTPNAGLAEFKFHTGKKHRLRLVNHAAEAIIFFSIDGYTMTVIANDFVAVKPYQTDLVTLGVGQRTEVIVQGGNNPRESVYMRMTEGPSGLNPPGGQPGCSLNTGVSIEALAPIYYEDADKSVLPNSTSRIDPSRYLSPNACANQPLNDTTPAYAMPVKDPSVTLNFVTTGQPNATGDFVWYLNNVTFYGDYNDPTL